MTSSSIFPSPTTEISGEISSSIPKKLSYDDAERKVIQLEEREKLNQRIHELDNQKTRLEERLNHCIQVKEKMETEMNIKNVTGGTLLLIAGVLLPEIFNSESDNNTRIICGVVTLLLVMIYYNLLLKKN